MRGQKLRAPRAFVRSVALALVLALVATGCLAGVGDPYYPTYGNGGYDVDHYDLDVRYDPATDVLQGVTTIAAHATTQLSRFDLDLVGLTVHRVTVNGNPAAWTRDAARARDRSCRGGRNRPAVHHRGRVLRRPRADGQRRLHRHGGRRRGLGRARRRGDMVPRERPPDRQGDVHLPRHRAVRCRGGRQRSAPRASRGGAGLDDTRLDCARADGELPRDDRHRELDGRRSAVAPRPAHHRRGGSDRPEHCHARRRVAGA